MKKKIKDILFITATWGAFCYWFGKEVVRLYGV